MRKTSKTLLLALGISLAGTSAAWAQQDPNGDGVWSLLEAVEYAKVNNLQVRQSGLNRKINEIDYRQAQFNRFPILNGNGSYYFNTGSFQDPVTFSVQNQEAQTANLSASASVPLFQGFSLTNQVKQNKLELEASHQDVLSAQNDITIQIVTSYLNILFADELIKTSELQREATTQQLERTRKLFEAGSVAENSVLDLESQLATDELNLINAVNQRDIARLNLMQLLNVQAHDDFAIEIPELPEPDEDPTILEGPQVYDAAVQTLPAIKAADLRVRSSEKGVDVARGAYFPRLSFGAGISSRYNNTAQFAIAENFIFVPQDLYLNQEGTNKQTVYFRQRSLLYDDYSFTDQMKDNVGKQFGFNLSIPIFNGFQARNNVQRAIVSQENAALNADIARNNLRQTIEQAQVDAVAARRKYIAAKEQVRATERNVRNAELRLNSGIINSVEYVIVANTFRGAQSELLQSKYEYIFKLKVLDFYQGKDISF
ncbi:outer membrane protein [Pontibacter mucosus]|uniref:Outer membrane protein n=1 Tax=Pontibacter mucosus TaxID=1649266 RepID=A0A2T5YLS1_9BACT|nr:TolC family protein [Pontibacter mucosus]PTX20241.1 outer membrane protein [Pontibacter mucosus]